MIQLEDPAKAEVEEPKKIKKKKKSKLLILTALFLIVWMLIITSGLLYFKFLDSNLLEYAKAANSDAYSAEIVEKYESILEQMSELNKKGTDNAMFGSEIASLSKEINELRVMHPYYKFKAIKEDLIPVGVPDVYGGILGISFDKVQESINVLQGFDLTYGDKKIELSGDLMKRYIAVGMAISCEYCCGVDAITKEDGEAACGCAHSQAMRGLTAYLLQNYADQYTDEQILDELQKWKVTYFPKQTIQKTLDQMKKDGDEGIEELLNEFPDFLPDMVGGC